MQEKKWDSPYKDWFHISFDGNSNYNDGFWYEGIWGAQSPILPMRLTVTPSFSLGAPQKPRG